MRSGFRGRRISSGAQGTAARSQGANRGDVEGPGCFGGGRRFLLLGDLTQNPERHYLKSCRGVRFVKSISVFPWSPYQGSGGPRLSRDCVVGCVVGNE